MRSIVLAAVLSLMGFAAHAQTPTLVDFATISMSAPGVPRTVTNTVCATDGNDLACDRGVYITPAGQVGIGIADPSHSLSVAGNVSASRYYVSPNAFISGNPSNSFVVAANTHLSVGANDGNALFSVAAVLDNQYRIRTPEMVLTVSSTGGNLGLGLGIGPSVTTRLQVNGTVRIAYGGESCDTSRTGAIRYTGGDFSFCRNGSAWETLASVASSSDRIVSGTSSVIVNSATSTISFSTAGSTMGWLNGAGVLSVRGRLDLVTGTNVVAVGSGAAQNSSGTDVTALGAQAAQNNNKAYLTAIGATAASNNAGLYVTAIGYSAAQYNSGTNVTAVGHGAAQFNSETNVTAIGYAAGQYNSSTRITAVGYLAARSNSGSDVTALGAQAAQNNNSGFITAVGSNAGLNNMGIRLTAIGYGASRNNSGTNVTVVGNGAGEYNIGNNLTAFGTAAAQFNSATNVTALGYMAVYQASSTLTNVTGLGYNAQPTKSNQVMLGDTNIDEVVSYGAGIFNKYVRPGSAATVSLPSATTAGAGAIMYDTTLGGLVYSNGSAWTAVAGGGGASADRIVSGTSSVVMNSATGIVSISQFGSVASYVHPTLGYVGPGVSTTGLVSTTGVYLAGTGNQCLTVADEGKMFRNSTTRKLQVCALRN